jgi:hypothetical protein
VPRSRAAELAPWLFLAQLGVTFLALIALLDGWNGTRDDAAWLRGASVALIALGAWSWASWRLVTGRLFDAYAVFLLALVVFSGGQMILLGLGLLPEGLLDGRYSPRTTLRAALLVDASVAAFHLGALLRARSAGEDAPRAGPAEQRARADAFRGLGLLLLAVSTPATIWQTIAAIRIVSAGGYMALYQQAVSVGLQNWDGVLAAAFPPALLMVFATHADRPGWRAVSWLLALVSAATSLLLGARAAALLVVAPMLLLHHALVAPLRRATVVALAAGGLALFPVIAQVRSQSLAERRVALAMTERPAEPFFVPAVREMGGTLVTLAETIELVPAVRPHDHGAGYLRALSTAVPNVFGDLHPAVRGGTWSQWLMARVDPVQFALGGGIGFSMIAEAWASFGLGAPLVLFAMGLLLGGAVAWCRDQPAAIGLVTEAVLLTAVSPLPRAETSNVVRGIVWYVVLPLLFAAWRARKQAPLGFEEEAPPLPFSSEGPRHSG